METFGVIFYWRKNNMRLNVLKSGINSILAGIMIAIGTLVFINSPNPIAGALLFSIGLLSILYFKFELYTGKIGYIRKFSEIPSLLIIILGNFIGCCILFAAAPLIGSTMFQLKLQFPWYTVLLKAILCGILIYIAVDQFKQDHAWITLLAVPAFILGGCEHCIADFCFMVLTRTFTLEAFGFLGLVILGNTIGSLLFSLVIEKREKICYNIENKYKENS